MKQKRYAPNYYRTYYANCNNIYDFLAFIFFHCVSPFQFAGHLWQARSFYALEAKKNKMPASVDTIILPSLFAAVNHYFRQKVCIFKR